MSSRIESFLKCFAGQEEEAMNPQGKFCWGALCPNSCLLVTEEGGPSTVFLGGLQDWQYSGWAIGERKEGSALWFM